MGYMGYKGGAKGSKGVGGKGVGGGKGEGRGLCRYWRISLGGMLGSGCPWGGRCRFRHHWEGSEGEEASWELERWRVQWWAERESEALEAYWRGVADEWEAELREGVEGEWEWEFRQWWDNWGQ